MTEWNGFVGAAAPLTEWEIYQQARALGISYPAILGVMRVEADYHHPGDGFDGHRRPKILFEPEHFYLNLRGQPTLQAIAQADGLALSYRPPLRYYSSGDSYQRLQAAVKIDETAALLSCSWGLGQVMGENFRLGGWKTVQEMVLAMMADEQAHLQAMLGFIKANHLVDELQRGDCAGFARVYNGSGYARDGYDTKLAVAIAACSLLPLPHDPGPVVVAPGAEGTTIIASENTGFSGQLQDAQRWLTHLGYPAGIPDGLWGKNTAGAVVKFEYDHGLPLTHTALDQHTYAQIMAEKVAPSEGSPATADDISARPVVAKPAGGSTPQPATAPATDAVATEKWWSQAIAWGLDWIKKNVRS